MGLTFQILICNSQTNKEFATYLKCEAKIVLFLFSFFLLPLPLSKQGEKAKFIPLYIVSLLNFDSKLVLCFCFHPCLASTVNTFIIIVPFWHEFKYKQRHQLSTIQFP